MTTPQILQPIPPGDGSGGVLPSSFVIGDILYADSTSTLHTLADVAVGSVLVSAGIGAAPAWSATSNSKFGSVAIGGATIGTNALAVTGTSALGGKLTLTTTGSILADFEQSTAGAAAVTRAGNNNGASQIGVNTGGDTLIRNESASKNIVFELNAADATLFVPASNSWQFGGSDIDTAPVAQTARTQGALAGGTSNVAGANWTFIASPGKGTGAGGSLIFQTAPAGSTGTAVNAPVTALTIDSKGLLIGGTSFTAATLPTAAAGNKGARTFITDGAATPVFGAIVTGSGSLFLPVFSDGTNWRNG